MSLVPIIVGLFAFGALLLWGKLRLMQANRELDQLFKINADLQAENAKQKAKIITQQQEVTNAKIKRINEENTRRNAGTVDDQLHERGYFRNDNGVSGVQSDLSKPCGHSGDETADSCSQSDL